MRKPVCATMRWSGRIDWPSTCQRALQHFERLDHAERRVRQLFAQPADLEDRREVRQQDAAGPERFERVLHDAPRLGEVEHDPVEAALLDAFVDVAYLDGERNVFAEETVHVLDRALREVVADLVAGDVARSARSRSSAVVSAPEPTPDSRMRAPGNTSASTRIGPRSFG